MTCRRTFLLLSSGLIAALALLLLSQAGPAQAAPIVTTDKPDYAPNETVVINGSGFNPGDVLDVVVIRPDGAIVVGDGSQTPGWDTVTANGSGWFEYSYQLDGVVGIYRIQVYSSPWNGVESFDIPMATTTFTDFTATSLSINSGAYSTPSLAVSLLVSWSGAGNDATQVRFANDLSPEGNCSDLGGGVFGPWLLITEDGATNTDTIPHVLASQTITGLRRVCSEVAEGLLALPINILSANDTIFFREPNPPLAQSCGVDMVIVMDSSGSMSATELAQMKSAMTFFTGAFLPETPTQIAIVEFDTAANVTQPFTSNETALNTAINAATSGGTTNWDDALADAEALFPHRPNPDLIVFASDGNPNTRGGHTHLGHAAATASVSEQDAMSWASAEANDLRAQGVRIVTLGIGDDLDTNNLITISGPVVSPPNPINANTDVITTGFGTLAFALAELAEELCGGTITVHKLIDADGNLGTTGDQSDGPNWTFSTNVDPPDSSTPPSGDTDGSGLINFAIDLGFDNSAVVDIIEPGEAGYTFLGANCTKPDGPDPGPDPDPVGTPGSMAVNNIPVGEQDIITCTFYNRSIPNTDVKITAQTTTAPPSANTGTPFVLDVKKTLHNNGPGTPAPVIITPTVMGPPDCTIVPNGGNPTGATLPMSVPTPITELFNVTCSQPSSHQFAVNNCIKLNPSSGLTDPNPGNDCWTTQLVNVNIIGQSDVKVQSVVLAAPPSANTGSPFPVTATANVHNNGPSGPTNIDTTFTLTLPGDCSTVSPNPTTIQNTPVGVSVVASIGPSWTVTCSNPSSHNFTATASAAIDQLHVTDPNGANNSGTSSPRGVNILANTDVKVSALNTSLPPSVVVSTPFTVTGSATLHNNGPFGPVNVDTSFTLLMPSDCTTSDPNPATVQNTALPTSTPTAAGVTWSVTCTNPSSHDFRTTASTAIDQLHVVDTNPGNNNMTSATATTAVNATSDVKVTTVNVVSPPTFGAYAPFNVTGQATLHNNGPAGPANVDTTVTLTMPGDCTTGSTNPVVVNNTSLPVSAATLVPAAPASWSVTCTNPGLHTFTVTTNAVIDQLHVVDPNLANNTRTASDDTDIIPAFITVCKDVIPSDSTVWDFVATGPSPGNINDLADGACAQFGGNMIPGQYTITETFQLGYAPSVDCGANGFQSDVDITFTLDPGEQVTCQYVNAFSPGPNPVGGIAGLLEADSESGPTTEEPAHREGAFLALLLAAVALPLVGCFAYYSWTRRRR